MIIIIHVLALIYQIINIYVVPSKPLIINVQMYKVSFTIPDVINLHSG